MNHIGETNKMVSDTPISDSTPHNVADLGMLCRRLERKLAATRRYLSEVTERAKRLEEAGDGLSNAMRDDWSEYVDWIDKTTDAISKWNKAKEAK